MRDQARRGLQHWDDLVSGDRASAAVGFLNQALNVACPRRTDEGRGAPKTSPDTPVGSSASPPVVCGAEEGGEDVLEIAAFG